MTEITVRFVPGSPFGRAVAGVLEEKGLPWRLIALRPGDHKNPAYLALHPFGRMPLIEHGDFQLYETQAILRYVDRIAPKPPLTPADPRAEARMNQVMGILDWYLFPRSVALLFPRVVAPRLGLPVDESGIPEALPQVKLCIDALSGILGAQDFMAGATPSLADFALAPHIDFLELAVEGREMLATHANLRAWLKRMNARPSLASTTWDAMSERAAAA